VARTIDSDRRHLTSVLRAAADHQGAAFIEIYQNCPIFNDDAFEPLKGASATAERLIKLEHGEPVRFAGGSKGLRFGRHGQLEAVEVAAAEGPGKSDAAAEGPGKSDAAAEGPGKSDAAAEGPGKSDAAAEGPGKSDAAADEDTLITHDAHRADPSYAFALSRLDTSDFRHTPVGVFRQVEQASYDQLMAEQIDAARSRSGPGDLAALLAGNDTWEVS
jgi:2-oxoglutarate ferredoxin oxidoreductase subunit beta